MARIMFLFGMIAIILLCSSYASAQPKIVQDGPFQIVTMQVGDQTVISISQRQGRSQDMGEFSGVCAPEMSILAVTGDRGRLKAFQASGNYADLQINDLVNRFREVLVEQCPMVTRITVTGSTIDTSVIAEMRRSEGWVIKANQVEPLMSQIQARIDAQTPAPQNPQVIENGIQLAFADQLSNAAVNTVPACEADVIIPLTTVPNGRKTAKMTDYKRFATEVAAFYSQRCPANQTIKLVVQNLPTGVSCPSGNCFISTQRPDGPSYNQYDPRSITAYRNWSAELNGYDFSAPTSPASRSAEIADFDDMLDLVKANDFTLIKQNYRGYFKLFHNQFLYAYSNQCAALIPDSVTFEFQSVETTIDGYGNEISSVETGPPEYITIEKSLELRFMAYKRANRARVMQDVFTGTLDTRRAGKGNQGINSVVGQLMEDRQRLNRFVAKGCGHPDVQSVYKNLTNAGPI